MEESREARTAIMTSWPTAMPAMAAELAIPREPLHHRVTITLTVGIDEPALPRAKTTPYRTNTCQCAVTPHIRPVPMATSRTEPASMSRMFPLSTMRPTKGIASAETTRKVVRARDRDDLLHPRSSDMGTSRSPKANTAPPPKNRTVKPVPRIAQLVGTLLSAKRRATLCLGSGAPWSRRTAGCGRGRGQPSSAP